MTAPTTPQAQVSEEIRQAHILVLKHWQSELAKINTPKYENADKNTIGYIAWFIDHALERAPEMNLDKLSRWVGYVQGVLAVHNYLNVDAERERTRLIYQRAYALSAPPARDDVAALVEALEPLRKYYELNDCDERPDDGALEIPISDLRAIVQSLARVRKDG